MSTISLIKDSDFTEYRAGLVVITNTQNFLYQRQFYRYTGTVPHVTTGISPDADGSDWESIGVASSDTVLRDDLADATQGSRLVGTNVDYVGTVNRTQYSKNRDYWSVKDYGAVGDGLTDDTAAILAAQADNCRWYPPGTYLVTNPLVIRQMGTSDGAGVVIYNGVNYPAAHNVTWVLDLLVPSIFTTIQSACDFAATKEITTGYIRVILADGEHIETNITPQVKNWGRFHIVGNIASPRSCGIKVDPTSNGCGFILNNGYGIGLIDGITIYGITGTSGGWSSEGVWNSQCYGSGIFVNGAGSGVVCGSAMIVEYLYYGFRAKFGGYIYAYGTQANHCGDCCYHAYAATIMASNSTATYARHTNGENLGFGFCAEAAGHIECENSNASYCQVAGFYSLGNSSMWAHACESFNNIGHGFYALNGGYLEANGIASIRYSNAYSNGGNGYYALNGAIMQTNLSYADNSGTNYLASNGSLLIS